MRFLHKRLRCDSHNCRPDPEKPTFCLWSVASHYSLHRVCLHMPRAAAAWLCLPTSQISCPSCLSAWASPGIQNGMSFITVSLTLIFNSQMQGVKSPTFSSPAECKSFIVFFKKTQKSGSQRKVASHLWWMIQRRALQQPITVKPQLCVCGANKAPSRMLTTCSNFHALG